MKFDYSVLVGLLILLGLVSAFVAYRHEREKERVLKKAERLGISLEIIQSVVDNMLPYEVRLLGCLDDEKFIAEVIKRVS